MKIELSTECDWSTYVGALGIEGFTVKITPYSPLNIDDAPDNDFKVDEIDEQGIYVWPFIESWEEADYVRRESDFIEWDRIETIYIY